MIGKSNPIERFSLPGFIVLTLLISFAIPLFLSIPLEFVALLLTFVPAILALIFSALTGGMKGVASLLKKLLQWRVGWRWYAIALGLALALRLVMSLLALLLGWIPAIQINSWTLPQFILIGFFAMIGATMEELGWRGYALPRMLENHPALISALFLGIPWGVVHLSLTLPGLMNANTPWLLTVVNLLQVIILILLFGVNMQRSPVKEPAVADAG